MDLLHVIIVCRMPPKRKNESPDKGKKKKTKTGKGKKGDDVKEPEDAGRFRRQSMAVDIGDKEGDRDKKVADIDKENRRMTMAPGNPEVVTNFNILVPWDCMRTPEALVQANGSLKIIESKNPEHGLIRKISDDALT